MLETLYAKNCSVDEGIKLVVKSLNAAIQRDSASGSGFDVVKITTKDGIQKIVGKQIEMKVEV